MADKPGLRIVGDPEENRKGASEEESFGATGFYYVQPGDAWGDALMSHRRRFSRLITLPAYVMRELLKGVLLSLAVFSVILMAVFAGQVMRDGIGVYTLIKVLPNFLPLICPFVMPLAIITGIIICYSRLAKDNEILAAYAGGINPLWLVLPALLTSVVAIFITLTLNEVALLPAIRNIESLVIDDQANILRRMITRPGNITVPTGDEYLAMSKLSPASDPRGRAALDLTRFASGRTLGGKDAGQSVWNPEYPYPAKRVVARDHEIRDFAGQGVSDLVLKMSVEKPIVQDLHATDINRSVIAYGESGEERVALGGRPSVTIHANRSSFWPILMLSETRREAAERLRELEAANARMDEINPAQGEAMQGLRLRLTNMIANRTSEINMRLALCFSCLAFAILGIPLGMRTRGTLITSFAAGIVVAGIYFLALKSGEMQVSNRLMPYWVIWIPDAVVVMLGLVLWFFSGRKG